MKENKKHYDKYKKFDVVYADFGRNPHGVQGGIRPGIVVSCDASNHGGAPQISVVPLSSKLKDNPVHVIVEPSEIRGYALSNRSDFMPEDIQTLNKGCVRFKSGYIPGESEIREAMDRAMIMQLNLLPVACKMVLEESARERGVITLATIRQKVDGKEPPIEKVIAMIVLNNNRIHDGGALVSLFLYPLRA